ncbi:MAG: amino acid permease [Candidatus Aminicenantes bacterium]|nr:MAG: amino acid permease [Candidatus Aminicenantes bacterium]
MEFLTIKKRPQRDGYLMADHHNSELNETTSHRRQLNWFDAAMIVAGATIGAGIFMNPAESAKFLQSSSQLLFVWALGGAIAFLGAFCFAELGALFPRSGGQYIYLEKAFRPWLGFLFGWTLFTTIQTGALAAVAFTCIRFVSTFVPMSDFWVSLLASVLIWGLTYINILGIKPGSLVQNVFTVMKILSLAVLIVVGVFLVKAPVRDFGPLFPEGLNLKIISLFGLALMPALFSYGGWQNLNFVAGEVKKPGKSIPLAIISGVSIVVVVYILSNLVYTRALPLEEISQSTRLAADSMEAMVGEIGSKIVALAIIISTFGFTSVAILTGPRVYAAMARDRAFLPMAARIHPRYQTPYISLILQSLWATVLLFTNTYGQLLQYITFGDWIFYCLTALALIVLRKKYPDKKRPYRVWGYPVVPVVFAFISAAVVINVFVSSPGKSFLGTAIILGGLPLFYLTQKGGQK